MLGNGFKNKILKTTSDIFITRICPSDIGKRRKMKSCGLNRDSFIQQLTTQEESKLPEAFCKTCHWVHSDWIKAFQKQIVSPSRCYEQWPAFYLDILSEKIYFNSISAHKHDIGNFNKILLPSGTKHKFLYKLVLGIGHGGCGQKWDDWNVKTNLWIFFIEVCLITWRKILPCWHLLPHPQW